jgi:plastocyanin
MRKLPFALILVALLVAAAPAAAKTRNVKIGDDFFVRNSGVATVTVKKGTTVKWNWTGHDSHNVVVSKGPAHFQSSLKTRGNFKRKLKKKGTYTIICSIHAPDMRMKLKVK